MIFIDKPLLAWPLVGVIALAALFPVAGGLRGATYANWSRVKLSTPSSAPKADEDGDGVPTIWEYYLNRNPAVADGAFPSTLGVDYSVSPTVLTAALPVPTPGTDAIVEWQVSSDLAAWTTVATSVNGGAFTGTGVSAVVAGTTRFRDPAPAAGVRRFARWTITSPTAGVATLGAAPVVRVLRDDRVATLEMDYDAENAWGQWWVVQENGRSDAGFRVKWWPDGGSSSAMTSMGGCGGCAGACGNPTDPTQVARQLVTGNRRVQIQPLANGGRYRLCIERINALGEVTSLPTELTFDGGDSTRVDALRASLTYFDDFNLPEGPADEKLWNNAHSTSVDPRFKLFFVNAQLHAHTLNGTQTNGPHEGDKSQVAQRFRKPIALENGVRRRIVFDMDSPLSPRSVWYLDVNPVQTDLTGHADFFDEDGAQGLPAGVLRLRSQGQAFSVHLIGDNGASYTVASIDMESLGVQAISNVRRAFDVRLGTDGIQVFIDGRSVINTTFAPNSLRPGAYELLWSAIGYNTSKDNNPYFLLHWDNFGFDGPQLDAREVHNYVVQIAGDDYQKSSRWNSVFPGFTIPIPDDLRPTVAGATAEAWLVYTYQMGDYSSFSLLSSDYVLVNGVRYTLPPRRNNSLPVDPDLLTWDKPYTVRIKLGDIASSGPSPLVVGNNALRFFADNSGILDVHIEVFYPAGSQPAYTPPAALHPFPMHADLPLLGPPARFEAIGGTEIDIYDSALDDPASFLVNVSGKTRVAVLAGGQSYASWAPDLMVHPALSAEIWSSGGVAGIKTVELFLRPRGSAAVPGERIAILTTQRDAPAPQVRHAFEIDTTRFPNGDYEIFVLATNANGVKSHPPYSYSAFRWDASAWSGAYFPINIRITN